MCDVLENHEDEDMIIFKDEDGVESYGFIDEYEFNEVDIEAAESSI